MKLQNEINEYERILSVFAKYEDEIDRLNKRMEFYEKKMEECVKLNELKAAGENYELKKKIDDLEKQLSTKNEDKSNNKDVIVNNVNNTMKINDLHAV